MKDLIKSTLEIQKHLTRSAIPSAVIGGLAVAVWGEPRLTRDVDLKILLKREESKKLIDCLGPDYQPLAQKPEETLKKVGFLFVKNSSGVRLDLLLADTPFDDQVIGRACPTEVSPGMTLAICSPEDLILYKMISTRPRDREDVRGILLRQKKLLDDAYILDWLRQFEQAFNDSTLVEDYRRLRRLS